MQIEDAEPMVGVLPGSVAILEDLVAFDTTSRNSNLALIDYLQDRLESAGVSCWLTKNAEGTKANLFGTLPAQDGAIQGGVVLSGHTDVVPVDGQAWDSDPFRLTRKGDRLFARGSADMKGFIACCMDRLPGWTETRFERPVHFAFSFDEELGCLGAPLMLEEMVRRDIRPAGCLIGEPTSMGVVVAHKGVNIYRCRVHGKAAHSSLPHLGANAIEYAARLICFIRDISDQMRVAGPFDEFFDTPFSTAQTGRIAGGVATNVVPNHCEFDFEFRNLPVVDAESIRDRIVGYANDTLLPAMRTEFDGAAFDFETIAVAAGLNAEETAAITRVVRELTGDDGIRKVAYGTEGGQFQGAGVPSIICGPGDIGVAHKANEFVEIGELAECEKFLDKLVGVQLG